MTLQDLTNPPAQCSVLAPADRTIMTDDALAEMVDVATHQAALDQIDEEVAAREKAEEEYKEKDLECDRLLEVTTAARLLLAVLRIEPLTKDEAAAVAVVRARLDLGTATQACEEAPAPVLTSGETSVHKSDGPRPYSHPPSVQQCECS